MVIPQPNASVPQPVPVVFMGSPAFAVPTLEALVADARFLVRLVVTQPPRPMGRGKRISRSAVHEAAERLGLPVWTPERLRGANARERLREVGAPLHIVAAYGKILRRDMLDIPTHGTLNVHASLLPAYRGASPITAAILDGVTETGVTIMLLDEGLDTGPILSQAKVNISQSDTTPALTEKLAIVGARLLVETAPQWLTSAINPDPQDLANAAYATVTHTLTKEDGLIDFAQPPERSVRMERAYTPWPGVYTFLGGTRLIVRGLSVVTDMADAVDVVNVVEMPAGTILAVDREGIRVAAGGRVLHIAGVQPEGKVMMAARAFATGRPGLVGMQLGAG